MKNVVIVGSNTGLGAKIRDDLLVSDCRIYGLDTKKSDLDFDNYTQVLFDRAKDVISNMFGQLPFDIDVLIVGLDNMQLNNWESLTNAGLAGTFNVVEGLASRVKKAKGSIIIIGSSERMCSYKEDSDYLVLNRGLRVFAETLPEKYKYIRTSFLDLSSYRGSVDSSSISKVVCDLIDLPSNITIPYIDIHSRDN